MSSKPSYSPQSHLQCSVKPTHACSPFCLAILLAWVLRCQLWVWVTTSMQLSGFARLHVMENQRPQGLLCLHAVRIAVGRHPPMPPDTAMSCDLLSAVGVPSGCCHSGGMGWQCCCQAVFRGLQLRNNHQGECALWRRPCWVRESSRELP